MIIAVFVSFGQAQSKKDIRVEYPDALKHKGIVYAVDKWEDDNGINYILISLPGEYVSKKEKGYESQEMSSYLYAYHYVKQGSKYVLKRKLQDYVMSCALDLTLYYVHGSIKITDLDNDGIKEVSFVYIKSCRSDVSPHDMRFMLLENGNKYPLRGSTVIKLGGMEEGGDKKYGTEFTKAPKAFKKFAEKQWNKYKLAD